MANLKTKEAIADLNSKVIPDAQARLAELNKAFGSVKISVDTDSFGNDFTELGYVFNELDKVYDGIKTLNDRSEVAKAELEAQLKSITLKLTLGTAEKSATFKGGELAIVSDSFNNNYVVSSEIVEAFEEAL